MAIRTFIAIELSAPTRDALRAYQQVLRDAIAIPVKWVNPESIHLTLKFLGSVEAARLDDIRRGLAAAAGGLAPFSLALGAPGAFPSASRPRVLWVGLSGDLVTLLRLQQRVEEEIAPLGWPTESRAFQPHLTLGRIQPGTPRARPELVEGLQRGVALPTLASPGPPPQRVESLSLMRSDLRPQGAVYTRLAEFRLEP